MVLDLVVVATGWFVAMTLVRGPLLDGGHLASTAIELILVLPVGVLMLSANGLYRRRICQVRAIEISRSARTAVMLSMLFGLAVLPRLQHQPGETVRAIVIGTATWFFLLVIERGVLREWLLGQRATGAFRTPVLVMGGDTASTVSIADFLADNPVLGFEVCGILAPADAACATERFVWRGTPDDLLPALAASRASGAVLDASSLNGQLNPAVRALSEANLHAHVFSGLRGVDRRRITLSSAVDETFLHVGPVGLGARERMTKRALDLIVATSLLILTSPILLVAVLFIRLADGSPVLFRQERVGHDGELFTVLKLRTMHVGADQARSELADENQRDGPLFKLEHDPRVSRLGRVLRATSIDELPQLLNVLEGTMSMVGPRPALPEEVAEFDVELSARLSVKPGLTGLWQVEARDLPSFDLYRRLDLLYVRSWSIGLDVTLMARTVLVVLLRGFRGMTVTRHQEGRLTLSAAGGPLPMDGGLWGVGSVAPTPGEPEGEPQPT